MSSVLDAPPHPGSAPSSRPAVGPTASTPSAAWPRLLADEIGPATEAVAAALEATAVARDRAGGHAAHERGVIRASGLLGLSIPEAQGGSGADWPTVYRSVRRLAQVDSALAHVYGFHHLQIASVRLFGSARQQARLLGDTVRQGWFWGNALNPLDARLVATPVDGGFRLDGVKSYASGSVGADRLTFSALVSSAQGQRETLVGELDARAPGVDIREDWQSFGQRQTDSGTVQFRNVFLPAEAVLQWPGHAPTPREQLRQLVSQLLMANLYLGIAQGAYEAARRYTRDQARPWFASGVARSTEDPYIEHRYGQLWLLVRPAELATDAAAGRLQTALDQADPLDAAQRGEVAIAIAEAKVLAHRASIEVATQLFELTGARATTGDHGFDRYWRNARVHTLHDPVDYKLRDIGRYRLDGRLPEPTPYS